MISTAAVIKTVTVNAPIEHVFNVFTHRFDTWWPRAHHIGKAELQAAIIETHEGGRWYERCVDGSECDWGRVLAYTPPTRIVLSWHLDANWDYVPDPARASRVEVTFHSETATRTRVEFVHSHLDRHGVDWEKLRDGISGPGGWGTLLEGFVRAAEQAA
jgi:uncharacterized protein YndB with AHSA1/START domain